MRTWRAELPILTAIFLDLLGFGMIIADIQLRAQSLIPRGWLPGPIIGFLLASTFVTQTLVSPRWGQLSDRIGRKPVLVACTLLSASAMFAYAMSGALWVLFVSRLLAGLGGANVAVAQAFISDRYDGEARTAALGRVGAAISLGLILGPAIGGEVVTQLGYHVLGGIAGTASLAGAVWIIVSMPQVKPEPSTSEPKRLPVVDLRLLRDYPGLRPLALIAVVAWLSLATLEGTFARLIHIMLGYGQREFGFLFSYEALLGFAIQGWLLAILVRKVRERPLLRVAYVCQGIGLALNPAAGMLVEWVPGLATLFVASTLFAIGGGVSNPTVTGLCSRMVPNDRQGELFGLLQGTRSIGFVVGPILGGGLFEWLPPAPYLLAGGVCLMAALLVPKTTT